MTTETDTNAREEAITALERVQTFDPESLVREKALGAALNFAPAVQPARRLIELFQRLTVAALQDFPVQQLNQVKTQANNTFNLFSQILEFDTAQANPHDARQNLIDKIEQAYQPAFQALHPLIAYSLHRSADFQRLDQDARATLQDIRDRVEGFTEDLEARRTDAERIVAEVREVAAETGVSQQAIHFRDASKDHADQAREWRTTTMSLAWALGVFAVLSFFIHKIPWFAPESTYDTIQLAVSKVLVFATISYMLYLAARNFLSHTHNAIVNKHRQDALMTYRALVDAAGSSANRDVVLTYAAACIFSPQATGYSGDGTESGGPRNVIELMSRQLAGDE